MAELILTRFWAITTWNALPAPLITMVVPGIITFQWCWALPLVNLLASGDSTAILAANTLALFRPLSPAGFICPVLVYGCFGFFTIAVADC